MPLTPGKLISSADIEPYALARQRIERASASTVVLVGPPPLPSVASYTWAIVQRHVSGWTCLATDTHDGSSPTVTADEIIRRYGDGFDRIPADHFRVSRHGGEMIHQRRVPGEPLAYCGTTGTSNPYVHIRKPGRYEQHCVKCTDTYRAEHYGRCPVMA